jgi:nicotinamide-nucleotide amidase
MAVRAGIVVTGTEVLTGRVSDRNGPWLAEQLRLVGLDVGRLVIVGDRPADLAAALRHLLADHDLVVTSGGLGPTADDLTVPVVAEVQGRECQLDAELERRIGEILESLLRRRGWRADPEATAAGVRKQATVPVGAHVLDPVGTAPGLVVPPAEGRSGPPVLVLPGPPAELRAMWPAALDAPALRAVLARATPLPQDTIRLWGTLESDLAATLRRIEGQIGDLDVSTCLRDGEVEIVTRYPPSAAAQLGLLRRTVLGDYARTVVSGDGADVDALVAAALATRGWTLAVAESCTGGLLGARITARPGSSDYFAGGVISYANQAKMDLLGVPPGMLAQYGAVSEEVAGAMAEGARAALHADYALSLTGVAGPDGGTEEKPVGLVYLGCAGPEGTQVRRGSFPGDRDSVRTFAATSALHLLRKTLPA